VVTKPPERTSPRLTDERLDLGRSTNPLRGIGVRGEVEALIRSSRL